MGFTLEISVPVLTVFLQGLLSFFSPCVLPLVPLYVGYLAGGAQRVDGSGTIRYPRGRVMGNTLCFVVGVSFAFFLLGLGFTALGRFFSDNQALFARASGVIMILFGIYQFGFLGRSSALERERRLPLRLDRLAMNPLVALALGFTFSFAWTPCVGPALSSVLLMASSAKDAGWGFVLIGVYTLGFVVPFLAVGLFTGTVLELLRRYQKVVRVTVKAGAALLILMGLMTLTGYMNGITSYLSSAGGSGVVQDQEPAAGAEGEPQDQEEQELPPVIPAPDFTLLDQYGREHTLSDYAGKTVFLNFWATWCGPCQSEMGEIQALYELYGENQGDVIVLGVANPKTQDAPHNQDKTQPEVEQFLSEGGYTFPVVMDTTGETLYSYGISAFPTTFMIGSDGNVFGYVAGALDGAMMESIIQQTIQGVAAREESAPSSTAR